MRPLAPLLAVLVLAPSLGLAWPALPPEGPLASTGPRAAATVQDVRIEGHGGIGLAATWFLPPGPGPFPAILRTHGWGGHREHAAEGMVARHLERGYAVLTYDSRGFGQSEGLVELNNPEAEAKDVTALVDWLARQPEVLLDAPGDPRVAMSGASYGGGIQLLAGVFEPRLDALAPEVTWHDLRHSLAPNGVIKTGWVALLYAGGHVGGHFGTTDPDGSWFHPNANGMDPLVTEWLVEAAATNGVTATIAEGLAARSLAPYLEGLEAFPPTMVYQGWRDTLFTPNEAVWTFDALRERGFQACLMVHGGGHGYGTPDYEYVRTSVLDFLDYWVLETAAPVPPPIEVYTPWTTAWRRLGAWPDAADGGTTYHLAPALAAAGAAMPLTGVLTEAAPPLDAPRAVLGTPRMHLALRGPVPDAMLFVELVEVGRDGEVVEVLGHQVTPLRVENAAAEVEADLELVAVAHDVPAGHRLGVRLSASDNGHGASRLPLPVLLRADGATTLTVPWEPAA